MLLLHVCHFVINSRILFWKIISKSISSYAVSTVQNFLSHL